MLKLYRSVMSASEPVLDRLLRIRLQSGKEDGARLSERKGAPSKERPGGRLAWVHAASVGEAQSALILIDALLRREPLLQIMVTTGTVTSANLLAKKLPVGAFHQFFPLDHPKWVKQFLDHWQPDLVLWMESELWPNMLGEIKKRGIPAALINAHLSRRSYRNWRLVRGSAASLLETFDIILAQTEVDAKYYCKLGAANVIVTDNLKYSANPLPVDDTELRKMAAACANRSVWVYASTHAGEEEMACRIHQRLQNTIPDLLTILVPRHPDRRNDVLNVCSEHKLHARLRGASHVLPQENDDIYIADTMGELGLFYRLAPIVCIGRSFSNDGGGGHNPIEAAQLHCAVLHGPHVQNLQEIYDQMNDHGAAIQLRDEADFAETLRRLFAQKQYREELQAEAFAFAQDKSTVLPRVLNALEPVFSSLSRGQKSCA